MSKTDPFKELEKLEHESDVRWAELKGLMQALKSQKLDAPSQAFVTILDIILKGFKASNDWRFGAMKRELLQMKRISNLEQGIQKLREAHINLRETLDKMAHDR